MNRSQYAILVPLFAVLALLLALVGTASAYVDYCAKNRVGGGADPAFYTGGFDSLALDTHQEITILCYDPATDVWFYVRQNPWTKFDPYGLWEWSKVGTAIGNGIHGAAELVQSVVGSVVEIGTGGLIGGGMNDRRGQIMADMVVGTVETGGGLIEASHQAVGGQWEAAAQTAAGTLGETPEEALGNVILMGASYGASRYLPDGSPTKSQRKTKVETGVQLDAPEVQAQLKSSALSKGDTYGHLTDHPSVGPGKDFTTSALEKAKADNLARNGGVMRDDVTAEIMTPHPRTTKGSIVPPSVVQGDHVIPKKPKDPNLPAGSNSFTNLKLRRAEHNNKKSNN